MASIQETIKEWHEEMIAVRNLEQASGRWEQRQHHAHPPHTAHAYSKALDRFVEMLAEYGIKPDDPIQSIQPKHFLVFPKWISKYTYEEPDEEGEPVAHRYTLTTKRLYFNGMLHFYRYLVMSDILASADGFKQKLYEAKKAAFLPETRLRRKPDMDAIDKCLEYILTVKADSPLKERNIAIWYFMADSGLRVHEVCKLTMADIDMDARTGIVIGKGNKQAKFRFSLRAAEYIKSYWEARGWSAHPNDPVFAAHDKSAGVRHPKHRHLTMEAVRQMIDKTGKDAGVEVWPHAIRHYFITRMYDKLGRDIVRTQVLARHKNVEMTRSYIEIEDKDIDEHYRQAMGEE